MPEFVNHKKIRTKPKKKTTSEMDDSYHTGKFRTQKHLKNTIPEKQLKYLVHLEQVKHIL